MLYVIDLFAGAGGFSSGVHQAGHTVVACIEQWDKGLAMHYSNFPDCRHIKMTLGGDIETFVRDIRALVVKLVPAGATWHLHASPPCQSFSIAQRQKKPASALADAEADERSTLLGWALAMIKQLQPPRWSLEQVPTALTYLRKHVPWIFAPESGIHIYPKVYGYQFNAPTMRKRLYLGKGWTLEGLTEALSSKKRRRDDDGKQLGLAQTRPALCAAVLAELNKSGAAFTLNDLAIKTSANKWTTSKKQREAGEGKNRWVDTANGEGLRLVDGSPSFAAIASYPLLFFKRTSPVPTRGHRTYLDGTWTKFRALKSSELAALQGFNPEYRIDELDSVVLSYFNSIADVVADVPPVVATVRLTNADKVRGVGNSVVATIAAQMFQISP